MTTKERAVPSWRVLVGDCRDVLKSLPAGSVHTCITSPPYFGLRDYGTGQWEGGDPDCEHRHRNIRRDRSHGTCTRCGAVRVDRQIGLDESLDEYVAALVDVFRGVRRALRDDGTAWLNLGDSYATSGMRHAQGIKPKDLIGVPWMVAFALRADGWHLRSDIVWAKPNPLPESVTDRPTCSHEYVFLLSKQPRYFYDAAAIREDDCGHTNSNRGRPNDPYRRPPPLGWRPGSGRNKRDVWTVAVGTFAGAHFAVYPPALIEPCVLAGCPERACAQCGEPWRRPPDGEEAAPACGCDADWRPGVVLDPFTGAGTTGVVALRHARSFVGIELNAGYAEMARDRIRGDAPLINASLEAT